MGAKIGAVTLGRLAGMSPTRRGGSSPNRSTTGPDDLVRVMRDERIIELRRDGHTYVQIGSIIGVPRSTVADAVKRWMGANGPSTEQVEELRQFQARSSTRARRSSRRP